MKNFIIIVLTTFSFCLSASGKNKNSTFLTTDTLKKGKNYYIFSKTKEIESVRISKNKKTINNDIKIHFGLPPVVPTTNNVFNSTMEIPKKYKPEDGALFVFDKIEILKGKYKKIQTSAETNSRNLFTLTELEFPLRLSLNWGKEQIDLELIEPGDWDIIIELKNN